VGLSQEDLLKVIQFAVSHIGGQYDLKNVIDLARYLIPTPPVPVRWRRRMLAFGSGDPTRAICSTLIAAAFEQVRYPILPDVTIEGTNDPACHDCHREVMHIRHYSLYTPRDFDISPYFRGGETHARARIRFSPAGVGGPADLKEERTPWLVSRRRSSTALYGH